LAVHRRSLFAGLAALSALTLGLGGPTLAQEAYPSRPIRLIVPFAPGGSADAMGRMIAEKFTAGLGQTVYVDIRAGAGGVIGSEAAARAAPDGHTLLLGIAATHAIQTALGQKLPYDVVRDFAPIGQISTGVIAVSVAANLPVKNLREFIDHAKANPGKVSYGTGGHASGGHLVGEGLAALAGIRITHIPYKGGAPAFNDMMSGQLQAVMTDTTTTGTYNRTGKVRVIAVAGPRRSPAFPDVPTTTEQGVPFEPGSWFALFAPAGTPAPVIERLNGELNKMLAMKDVQERMTIMGIIPTPGEPEAFRKTQQRDIEVWTRVVRNAGIKVEQ
jgi:tripartite-type tricarboxylate transporter receptor subunit TctC